MPQAVFKQQLLCGAQNTVADREKHATVRVNNSKDIQPTYSAQLTKRVSRMINSLYKFSNKVRDKIKKYIYFHIIVMSNSIWLEHVNYSNYLGGQRTFDMSRHKE
jgi:hypothetical protein